MLSSIRYNCIFGIPRIPTKMEEPWDTGTTTRTFHLELINLPSWKCREAVASDLNRLTATTSYCLAVIYDQDFVKLSKEL